MLARQVTKPLALLSLGVAFLSGAGCTSAPARAALQGDLARLKSEVQQAHAGGALGQARAREVARAVLARELVSLQVAADDFPDVAACSDRIRGALEDVAEAGGEFAGPAAVALIDAGFDAPRASLESASARDAVLARKALGRNLGVLRREYMLHGDADVRRAAFRAAAAQPDAADAQALLEAARLDPDPLGRALAVAALARIGGEPVVLGLVDVWTGAPAELRFEILDAWASPRCLGSGGEAQLVYVAERGAAELAVAAAILLEREGMGPAGLGTRVLLQAISGQDVKAQRLALRDAPWDNAELRAAIIQAAKAAAVSTRLLALARIAEHGELDAAATAELARIAQSPAEYPPTAVTLARAVLARAGDERARDGLRADLAASKADQRLLAALSLVWLDDWGAAAQALADDSPNVRRGVACHMLAGSVPASSPALGSFAPKLLALLDEVDHGLAAGRATPAPRRRP